MRRLGGIISLLSLLLLLTAVVMWIRCRWWQDTLSHARIDGTTEIKWQIESSNGQFSVVRMSGVRQLFFGDTSGWSYSRNDMVISSNRVVYRFTRSGQYSYVVSYAGLIHSNGLALPYWIIILITAIAPAFWLRETISRRRRLRTGVCKSCGYNLTGNTSGVCPECGAAITPNSP
jgi:hypothetical protein